MPLAALMGTAMKPLDMDQVCGELYEAASIPKLWPKALGALAAATRSDGAHFTIWNTRRTRADLNVTARGDVDSEISYATYYGAIDPRRRILDVGRQGRWLACHQLFDEAFVARDEYFNDFFLPLGYRYTAKYRAYDDAERGSYAIVGLTRSRKSGIFQDAEIESYQARLQSHLCRAAALYCKLAPARVRGRLVEAALDHVSFGLLLLGPEGQVLIANQVAQGDLEDDHGLVVRRGKLEAREPGETRQIQHLIAERRAGSVRISSDGQGPAAIALTPLSARVDLTSMRGDPGFLALIVRPQAGSSPNLAFLLRNLYGLTPTEARLAITLGRGLSPREAGFELGQREATTRQHLKHIFSKMEITRQSQLASVVASLGQLASSGGAAPSSDKVELCGHQPDQAKPALTPSLS